MKIFVQLTFLGAFGACSGPNSQDGRTDTQVDTGNPANDVPQVFVNELMSSNATVHPDEVGAFPDWVELYNPNSEAVDLSGWWLSDDTGNPFNWQFPEGITIGPSAFLVVFADDDPEEGDLHATFKLDGLGGEDVALYGPNVVDNPLVDSIEDYQTIITDYSLGRMPDGTAAWEIDSSPTPGAANN